MRPFHRKAKSEFAAKILDHPESVLPCPAEANLVLRVNGHRQDFCSVCDSLSGLRRQRPLLTAGKNPPTLQCGLGEQNPLAKNVTVALSVIGSDACPKKVTFPIPGEFGTANVAFSKQREAALTSGEVTFINVSQCISLIGNAIERRIDVRLIRPLAGHRFCRDETARRQGHAFVMNGCRRLGHSLLSLLQVDDGVCHRALQVGHIGLQLGDGGLLLRSAGLSRVGLSGGIGGGGLRLLDNLVLATHFVTQFLQLLLLLGQRGLLRCDGVFECLHVGRGDGGRRRFLFRCLWRGGLCKQSRRQQ